jgi:hypothetical protein
MRRGVSSFMDMPTMKISSHGLVICIGYPWRALAWQVRYVCLALASQKNKYSKSRNTKSLYQACEEVKHVNYTLIVGKNNRKNSSIYMIKNMKEEYW